MGAGLSELDRVFGTRLISPRNRIEFLSQLGLGDGKSFGRRIHPRSLRSPM